MPVCATCQTDGQTAGSACRFCGAWVSGPNDDDGDRSLQPHARAPSAAQIEIAPMELELDIPSRRSSGGMPAAQAAPPPPIKPPPVAIAAAAAARPLTVPTSSDLDMSEAHGMLELDIQAPAPSARQPSSSGMSSMGGMSGIGLSLDQPPSSRVGTSSGAIKSRDLPAASSRREMMPSANNAEEIFEDDAHALADYGEPPASIWRAPLYSLRVYKRQKDLRDEQVTREEDFARAKKELEEALVALGQRARKDAAGIPKYKTSLDAITAAEALLQSRDGQVMAEVDAQNKKVVALDKRVTELEAVLAAAFAEQKKVEAELARVQDHVSRLDAQDEAARKAAGGPTSGVVSSGSGKR